MLELLLKLSDITEKIFPLVFLSGYFDMNQSFFASLFFGHTGSGLEYVYLSDDNIFYVFLFLLSSVLIDLIFFFFGKKIAQLRGKKLSSNYPVSLENYFLLYFRFIPFFGYFGSTILGYYSEIKIKKLILKILLGNIIRGSVIVIGFGVVSLFQKFYFYQFLGQIDEDYFIFTHLTIYLFFYFSFVMIISIFYGIKFQKLKKQRKYG